MKTAVEWLEKEFVKLEFTIGVNSKMYDLLEQAKELEKQQIIDAYTKGNREDFYDGTETSSELYYNETFNK